MMQRSVGNYDDDRENGKNRNVLETNYPKRKSPKRFLIFKTFGLYSIL